MSGARPWRARSWAVALLSAACTVGGGVEPLPLRGAAPQRIAVWPIVEGGDADVLEGLAPALQARGYDALPPALVGEMLQLRRVPVTAALATIGRELQADAVLQVAVDEFDVESNAHGRFVAVWWHLRWQLMSTRGDGEQWAFDSRGSWRRGLPDAFDPGRSLDDQQDARDIVPIGGRAAGQEFEDVAAWLRHLHRTAMDRLPRRVAEPVAR